VSADVYDQLLDRVFTTGPHDRADRMVAARTAGMPLATIGSWFGVSRQRVQQITVQQAPWRPWDATATEQAAVAAEIDQVLLEVHRQLRPTCRWCGHPAPPPRTTSCTGRCAGQLNTLRYHLDGRARRRQRLANARQALASNDPAQRSYARRVLDHDGESLTGRRWLIEGSAPWRAVAEAIADNLPVLDLLDPALIEQVTDQMCGPADHDLNAAEG